MKQSSINDIIKGYTESVEVTKDNIDDLTVEIAMMAKQSSDFIKESSITRDDIYKNLSKHIVSTSDNVNKLNNSVKKTSSNIKENNTETKKNVSKLSKTVKIIGTVASDVSKTANVIGTVTSNISKSDTVSTIKQQSGGIFRDIMGDTAKYFTNGMSLFSSMKEDTKNIMGSTAKYFTNGMSLFSSMKEDTKNIFKRKDNIDNVKNNIKDEFGGKEKTVGKCNICEIKDTLEDSYKLDKQKHLEGLRERKKSNKVGLSLIGVVAALIGGLIRKLELPFEILFKATITIKRLIKYIFKEFNFTFLSKMFEGLSKAVSNVKKRLTLFYKDMKLISKVKISDFIIKLKKFSDKSKIMKNIDTFFSNVKNKIKFFEKISKYFLKKTIIFKWLFNKVKWGFKHLGWPIQIVFSLLNFIKGFRNSEGKDFLPKFMDGVIEVVSKFFELPIRLLAWVVEKLSFGKFKNLGDKWYDTFKEHMSHIMHMGEKVVEFIKDISKGSKFFTKGLGLLGKLFPAFIGKLFYPVMILFSVYDFIKGFMKSKETSFFGKLKDGITLTLVNFIKLPLEIFGWIVDKIIEFVTGHKPHHSIGHVLVEWTEKITSFVIDWMLKPFRIIWEYLKMIGNIFTGDFEGAIENIKNIGREMFSPIIDFFKNVSQFIWNLIPDKIQDHIKDIFSPITGFFVKIGKFVGKILSFVASKLKKIPVIGKFFKSDNEKNTEKINDLVKQKQKLKQDIAKQEQEIKSGDNRTWTGRKRTTIIKNKKEDITKINKQLEEEKAKQGTVVYEKVKGKLKVKHDYRTEFQKQRALTRKEEFKKRRDKFRKTKEKIHSRTASAAGVEGIKSKAYSRIKKEEGYRKNLYRDSRGYWTGGYGTLISNNKSITKKQANILANKKFGFSESMSNKEKSSLWNKQYNKDFIKAKQSIEKYALKQGVPLNGKQKDVLTDMSYNMGIKKLSGFHNMWGALKKGDTNKAANEMMDSKWYSQVGDRSKNLVAEMRSSKSSQLEGINGAVIAKANMKKREVESRKGLGETISKNMKNMNKTVASNQQTQPVVINNNNQNHEPPEDIESMSILWLNKSYGLG